MVKVYLGAVLSVVTISCNSVPAVVEPDVRATPAMDAAALAFFADYPKGEELEAASMMYCGSRGGPHVGAPVYGEKDNVWLMTIPGDGACAHVHTHPRTGSLEGDRADERHSMADRGSVRNGHPNYLFTPSRKVRVLERINGRFVARDVLPSVATASR